MTVIESPLTEAAEGLSHVKKGLADLLSDPQYASVLLYAKSALDAMINRFHFLAGTTPTPAATIQFPPVTNFMGEELNLPKSIKAEDLSPDDWEREQFVDKVNRLYAVIQTIPVDGILNSYTLPEDQLVIRGVAKRAGVEGYEDREISPAFISDIYDAIKAKEAKSIQESQIEQELENQTRITALLPKLDDAKKIGSELSAELALANNELADANTEAKKTKAQKRVNAIQADVNANIELQLNLEDEINKLKGNAGTAQ